MGRDTVIRSPRCGSSCAVPGLVRQVGLDRQLAELVFVDGGRGAAEQVGCLLCLGKGNHVADVVLAGEDHDPAIQSQGDTAVWWCPVSESLQQEPEPLLGFLCLDPQQIEDGLLDVGVMDTNAAATGLVAVADQVV